METKTTNAATSQGGDAAHQGRTGVESNLQMSNPSTNTAMEQTNNRSQASNGDDAIRRNTTVSLMAIGATAILGFIVFAAVRQNTK